MSPHTQGPWDATEVAGGYRRKPTVVIRATSTGRRRIARVDTIQDADFIVHACNAYPALLSMVERYASECGECGGSGEKPFYSPEGTGGRMPPETPPCDACADIRALLKSARGNQS